MGIQLNGNNDNISAVDGDLSITGIVTFSQLDVGNNIKFGNAGVVTATSYRGDGSQLTGISAGVSLANGADNRVVTATGAAALNAEANLTYDGTTLNIIDSAGGSGSHRLTIGNSHDLRLYHDGNSTIGHYGDGDLYLTSENGKDLYLRAADDIFLKPQGGENGIIVTGNGSVALFYDNVSMLETEARGSFVKKADGGETLFTIGSTNAGGVRLALDGDSNGDATGFDYAYLQHNSSGDLIISADNPAGNSNLIFQSGNSSEKLRIDSSGRVLIGSTGSLYNANSYSNNLIIYENGDTGMSIIGNNSNSNYASLYLSDTTTPSRAFLEAQLGADGPFTIGASGTGPIRFNNNGAERVRITGSGTLSINQSSPDSNFKLYVEGQGRFTNNVNLNDGKMVYFGDSDTAFVQGYDVAAGGYLVLGSNNEKVRINSNGDNGFLKIADNNTTSVSNHGFRFGSWGIQMRDTGGYNHWFIRRNYGGWQHVPHVTLRANGYTGLNRAVPEETLDVDGGARFRSYVYIGDGFFFKSNAFGGNTNLDTGISINQGGRGGCGLLLVSRNYNNGTGTSAGIYRIKWYYDGNNAPATHHMSGDNFISFGVSASNTLTINGGGGNQLYGIINVEA